MRKLPVFCLPRGMFGSRSRIAEEKRLPLFMSTRRLRQANDAQKHRLHGVDVKIDRDIATSAVCQHAITRCQQRGAHRSGAQRGRNFQ